MYTVKNPFEIANALVAEKEKILSKYNFIRLAAYRTASKLRSIQKAMGMSQISLATISCIFERHQLQKRKNLLLLDKSKIESILSDIYFMIYKENEVNLISQLMTSFLLILYDSERNGQIPVISLKICLTLLCLANPREKYSYFFNILADSNNCLPKEGLKLLLKYLVKVIDFVGESPVFGSNLIEGTIKSCFEANNNVSGVLEDDFISWLTKDPQLLIWLSVLYRIEISEAVSHPSDCRICKTYPIVGLRYQCLKCLSLSMCQNCFFSGKTNKKHKLKHPVKEYCYPQTATQTFKTFFLTIGNILCKKNYKLQYLPIISADSSKLEAVNLDPESLQISFPGKIFTDSPASCMNSICSNKLLGMILNLEKKNKELISEVETLELNAEAKSLHYYKSQLKSLLLKHKLEINYQIEQLKLLRKEGFMVAEQPQNYSVISSTPVVKEFSLRQEKKKLNKNVENLSPIIDCMSFTKKEFVCEEPSLCLNISQFAKTEKVCQDRNSFAKSEKLNLSTWLDDLNSNESGSGFSSERLWLGSSTSEEHLFEELDSRLLLVLNKLEDLLKDSDQQDCDQIVPPTVIFNAES